MVVILSVCQGMRVEAIINVFGAIKPFNICHYLNALHIPSDTLDGNSFKCTDNNPDICNIYITILPQAHSVLDDCVAFTALFNL